MRKFKSFSVVLEVTSVVDSDNGDHCGCVVLRNPSNGQVLDVCQVFDDVPSVLSDLMDAVPLQSSFGDMKAASRAGQSPAGASEAALG